MVNLLQPFINMVVQKSGQAIIEQCALMIGVNDEREKLHLKLLSIEDVLSDAEERSGTEQGRSVKAWLAKLKKVAYEADDVLDEFQYEAIKKEVEAEEMPGYAITKSVRNFFSTSNPTLFRYTMGKRLKDVLHKIDAIVQDMGKFGFVIGHQVPPNTQQPRSTTSVVDESEIVGRDQDVDKLVETIINSCNGENVRVISIVGMGGLGKTTLARLIFNNQKVEMSFGLRFWISVTNDFSVDKIAKSMIDYHKKENSNLHGDNMELLQLCLGEIIGSKRYLLVLDDVWSVDPSKWEELENMLRCSSVGSVVVVTSRIEMVASTMKPVRHDLEHLNKHDSWTIFQRRAFGSGVEECAELVKIGEEIVRKCGGVPLAIKSLGMLLSEKYKEREWQAVLDSKSWENGFEDADDVLHKQILHALRVSYDHLPSHVKQCFAFCVVFPKGYVMDQETLIQLWVANGFIQCEGTIQAEDKGEAVISMLKRRYFIQPVKNSDFRKFNYRIQICYNGKLEFSMHDLIHDLALSLLNNENVTLNSVRNSTKSSTHLNHFLLEDPTSLRSFLSLKDWNTGEKYSMLKRQMIKLSRPSSLRAFEFCAYPDLTLPKLPTNMKHIRYLDLSWSSIRELPEEMNTFYHLQTLKLSHCNNLVKLPKGMRYMRSLRQIYINGCYKLKRVPPGLGQLKKLRTLTDYIVDNDAGCQITELQDLDLHGKLEIYNLREVKRSSDAAKANIFAKKNLDELLLSWCLPDDTDWEADDSKDVLNALKPHKGLKVLEILQYGGVEFPNWMRDLEMFQSLVELSLDGCERCKNLPQVNLLPALESLKLCNMHELTHICDDSTLLLEGDNISKQFFPKLKMVRLSNLRSLEGWHTNENLKLELPQVESMVVYNCPILKGMPNVPKCKWLVINGNSNFQKWVLVQPPSQPETGSVSDPSTAIQDNYSVAWKFLEVITLRDFQSMDLTNGIMYSNVIRRMHMFSCYLFIQSKPSRFHTSFWRSFTCLARLEINKCDTLVPWPEMEFENLNCLKFLSVYYCENFTGKPQTIVPPSSSRKETLLVLEDLEISRCPKLQEFPTNFRFLKRLSISDSPQFQFFPEGFETLTSLERLKIRQCEKLQSLPPTVMSSLPGGMEKFTALKRVYFAGCPKIAFFPDGLQQRLNQLEFLEIYGCPDLARQCKKGEYRHLVSEIPKKWIQEEQGFTLQKCIRLAIGSSCGSTRQLDTTLPDMSYWISTEK